jgi:hypothetical protein
MKEPADPREFRPVGHDAWPPELRAITRSSERGTPSLLFKYLPPTRFDVLARNELRFTQPSFFNDPFDSRPYFRNLPRMPQGPWDTFDVWEDAGSFDFSRYFCRYMETAVEANREIVPKLRGDELRQFLLSGIGSTVGILSLSEVPDDPLMWGHYAASHCGFAIGFDTSHPFFRCTRHTSQPTPDAFFPVHYAAERPRRRSYEHVTARDAFFTKSPHWAYEKEWRRYRLVRHADTSLDGPDDEPIALFRYPREAVRVVIFGMDMDRRTFHELRRIMLTAPEYRTNVLALHAYMDSRYYRMRFEKLPWC